MSTYGPSERKMLKAQRESQKAAMRQEVVGGLYSETNKSTGGNEATVAASSAMAVGDEDGDAAWTEAFAAAKKKSIDVDDNEKLSFDGYALRDLIVSKWGIPLDVDFQRIGGQIYCTVLPALGHGGGPLQSRHQSELEYLMHLQGVIETLHKYDNLYQFLAFVETTKRVPKRGTDSVPFRLDLSKEDIDKIMNS